MFVICWPDTQIYQIGTNVATRASIAQSGASRTASMYDLNKIFPWLSIRSKLIIAFTGLSIIPVALVGLHGIFSNVKMMKDIAYENLSHDVHIIRRNTSNFLSGVDADLRLIRNFSSFRRLELVLERSPFPVEHRSLQQLTDELLAFAESKNIYYQVRLLNGQGDELLRVESESSSDQRRVYRSAERSDLNQSRESYYSLLVENLRQDEIIFAAAELSDRNNNRVPVISFAMPINGAERRLGILIANVYAKDLFQAVEAGRHLDVKGKVVLVNNEGHYLYHSDKKKEWNKLLASREEDNLARDYPSEVTAAILSGKEGIFTDAGGEIISYGPLFYEQKALLNNEGVAGLSLPFFVFEALHEDVVLGPAWSFAWTFGGFLVLFLGTSVGLGLLATRQFTRPIADLQQGAEIIARGNYGHRLDVKTHDEIEKLGEQFNLMARSLEEHEREIQRHRQGLEVLVQQRTRELTEEKTKLKAILDNVPNAFVLLDEEYRIVTASATFAAVTGLQIQDVRGKDCADVFCKNGFCKKCVSRQAVSTGRIASHIDMVASDHGAERFIEHTAIPLHEDGHIKSILEIITDVTERKRFEQHLLQTERLMATGEMSALIAHEFRNSLTSVKMILQLQSESKRRNASEKKSLTVALNSIHHMEQIVAELLSFARPTPLQFQATNVTSVIHESLSFVEPHFMRQRIQLSKSLDSSLPLLLLDSQRFKETLVNILLNAVQAIETKPERQKQEVVSVTAKRTFLRETLRDFTFNHLLDGQRTNNREDGREIVLLKGSECAVVSISDSGPGISKGLRERIFDPFFTTKANGTGLGLPMVKQTVHAHGGIVNVKCSRGQGTTFSIFLPLSNGARR
ncbi:MAG: PAS domain S-box protein [Ignavibacteriales bacterium]|nr:PAS domain S-box protein [Ignavibacteriales bacterium]